MKTIIAEPKKSSNEEMSLKFSDISGNVIRYYGNLQCNEKELNRFAEMCNSCQVSPEHIDELVYDFLVYVGNKS